jgi:hypothetical protein
MTWSTQPTAVALNQAKVGPEFHLLNVMHFNRRHSPAILTDEVLG